VLEVVKADMPDREFGCGVAFQSFTTKEGPQSGEGWSLKEDSQQIQEHEWQPSSNKEAQHIRQSCW
jgi:hypothetical protein